MRSAWPAAARPGYPASAARLRYYLNLRADPLTYGSDVGNNADHLSIVLQAREGFQSGVKVFFIQGSKPSSRNNESTRTFLLAIWDNPSAKDKLTIKLSPPERFFVERTSPAW